VNIGLPGLSEEYLPRVVDGQDCLAFGTPETARLGGLELLVANGTRENFGEYGLGAYLGALMEIGSGLFKVVLDIEELREPEQLEHLVHLGLNLQQDNVSSAGFDRLQERGERAYACR